MDDDGDGPVEKRQTEKRRQHVMFDSTALGSQASPPALSFAHSLFRIVVSTS